MSRVWLALAAAGMTMIVAAPAQARTARCVIGSNGHTAYSGPCDFAAERGGSFTLTPARGRNFGDGVTNISVSILDDGTADVSGLTSAGINSRWGAANRSPRDRACWVGEDFSVCAY